MLSAYYVSPSGSDSAAGGSSAPWKTLQKAANNAKAGDVVHVGAGTYNSGMNFFGKAGGTASAPISFIADPGAVITHCATSGMTNDDLAGINVENTGGWYVFQGFTVNSDGSMQRGGIRVAYSNNVKILNNSVNAAFIGIFASNADNLLIQNNTCTNSTDQHGIYVSLNTHNAVIRANVLHGNNWDGLHMNALNGSPNDGALVEDNVIYGNGLSGMDIEGVTHATFRNNLIYNNPKHGITIHSQDQANTPVASNNTFVNNTIAANGMFAVQVKAEDAGGETFFNNVLGSSSSIYGSIGTSGSTPTMVSDYNVVLDNFSTNLGVSKMTLAQWQSATGQDKHSVVASPSQLFVNPSANDYHLKGGSLAIDVGAGTLNARPAPADDLAAAPRPQGLTWDAGAYEYASTTSDTTPPTISGVAASNLTASAASVAWNTNEAADTQVEYGTSTAYGASTSLNATDVTSHSATLSGLSASTLYHYRVKSRDAAGNLATSGDFTFTTSAAPDTTSPTVVDSSFDFSSVPQGVTFKFSENVSAGLNGSELSIVNLTTGAQVAASDLSFTYGSGNVASWTYVPGVLPDGDYRATLSAGTVRDAAGNTLGADSTLDFFVLEGDANRDRTVDFNDLVSLAQNYTTATGMAYSQGDLNMDQVVNFNDLVILAQHYNTSLPPAPPAAVAVAQPAVLSAARAATTAPNADETRQTTPVFSTTSVRPVTRQPRHRARWMNS
jgi:parallel beta-helix repeat protein